MNLQMFYVNSDDAARIIEVVQQRISAPSDDPNEQPDWGLPSSYDVLLAKEKKRKIVLSPPVAGWVAGVESKEVNDFALLQRLAETLKTRVVAILLSEVTGHCGYAMSVGGNLAEHQFSDDNDDPAGAVVSFLRLQGIPFRLCTFSQAVQMRRDGWMVIP